MARYRHYKNFGVGGDTVFVTTTCLDHAHLLKRDEIKQRLVKRLISDHHHYGATLHAYVVMSNHIHFVSRMPPGHTSSWFLQRLKSNSSKELISHLNLEELRLIDHQRGLDGRQFWKRSFDSLVIREERAFWQKIGYIHRNPIRAELVTEPQDYAWSSAKLFYDGGWNEENGLMSHLPLIPLPPDASSGG